MNEKIKKLTRGYTPAKYLTTVAVFAALASGLMFLDFSLPFMPFVSFDFSDLPALIAAFALGPIAGVAVELIKNLFHLLGGSTGGVGELANFIMGCAFVIPASLVYRRGNSRKFALIGMAVGAVSMVVTASVVNYFITIPFFSKVFLPMEAIIAAYAAIAPAADSLIKVILIFYVPFNLAKAVILSGITFFAYKSISNLIKSAGVKKKTETDIIDEAIFEDGAQIAKTESGEEGKEDK
ncbi:MAG: ECF transporter S component [Clostridiales bacterium]|nr:ECF transporter S component [Clostridiales bacterium]